MNLGSHWIYDQFRENGFSQGDYSAMLAQKQINLRRANLDESILKDCFAPQRDR